MMIIAVVVLLLVYEIYRSGRVSSQELIFFVVLVPSIILHEVSHGWVALMCGDDTAKRAGRLTLNPIRHIDLVGTIILPVILILTTGYAFGYAKPVPVNVSRLRHPRNQSVLVSLAGPVVNIVIALVAAAALRTAGPMAVISRGFLPSSILWQGVFYLGFANVIIAIFNLLPIPPLDGSAVVERLLPRSWWPEYLRLRRYALPVLIVLVLLVPAVREDAGNWGLRIWTDLLS